MPLPMQTNQNIRVAQGGKADFAEQGRRTVQAQLGKLSTSSSSTPLSISTPLNTNTTPSGGGVTTPGGGPSLPTTSRGSPSVTTLGGTVADVLTKAGELANEDVGGFSPYPTTTTDVAPPRPGVIVMPEHYIFGDPTPDPVPAGSSPGGSAPPPPPAPSLTRPPLVSAPKKSPPWGWLALGALAVAAAFA